MQRTTLTLIITGWLMAALLVLPAAGQVNVLTQHNDNMRTGANVSEIILNTTNVNANRFGKLFTRTVDGYIWAQPLYVANLAIPNVGTRNVVFVATNHARIYAFDADNAAASAPLWTVNLQIRGVPAGADSSNTGVLSTPVIDLPTKTMYLVTREVQPTEFRLFALDITTGAQRANSPVLVTAGVAGTGTGSSNGILRLLPNQQKQRPSLLLANGNIYLGFGGSVAEQAGDIWNGWLLAYDAATLTQTAVFCVAPDANGGGIWMSGQGPSADDLGNIYLATANGNNAPSSFDANSGGRNYGDCLLKFNTTGGGLNVVDWFAPFNNDVMEQTDQDFGNTGVLLIPGTNLALSGDKLQNFYLFNRSNLGHFQAGSNSQIAQAFNATNGHIHGSPIYWNSPSLGPLVYIWSEDDTLRAYRLVSGLFQTTPVSRSPMYAPSGMPGAMLSLSANGSTAGSGIVWAALPFTGDANAADVPGVIRAFDAANVSKELWNSRVVSSRDDFGIFSKFAYPTIANGKLYVPTFSNRLVVYGLLPSAAIPPAPAGLTATAQISRVLLNWTAASGATTYTLKRGTATGGPYTTIATNIPGTSYIDTAVTNGTLYYYVVTAGSAGGDSANSNEANARPFAPAAGSVISIDFVGYDFQGTPTTMAASEVAGVVPVASWNATFGNTQTGGLTQLRTNSGSTTAAAMNWTANRVYTTDIPNTAGNSRMMKGVITNDGGVTTIQVTGLPAPFTTAGYDVYVYCDGTNPSATRTGIFAIGARTDSATDAKNRNFDGTLTQGTGGSIGNYVVLPNITGSSFTLTATPGASDDSTPRAEIDGIQIVAHQAVSPPAAPTGLQATAGSGAVSLSWNAVAGATSYNVKRATVNGGPYSNIATGVTSTGYLNSGLTNGTIYYYVVSAVNSAGESPNSAQVNAKPMAQTAGTSIAVNFIGGGPNGTPANMAATETAGVVPATHWNNAANHAGTLSNLTAGGGAASGAAISWIADDVWSTTVTDVAGSNRMMKGDLITSNTSTTTIQVTNLPPSFASAGYDVFVYYDDDTVGVTRTGNYKIGATTISGADNAQFGGTFVKASAGSVGNYVQFTTVTGTSFTLTATPGTSTDAVLRAPVNGLQIVAHAPAAGTPAAATGLVATAGNARVALQWNSVANATGYNVKRGTASGGPFTTIASNVLPTTYLDSIVSNGTTYYYVVSALNGAAEGANSNLASAQPKVPANGTVISIDFTGGGPNGNPTAMGATEVAGVVPVANWNSAPAASGTINALLGNGGASTGAHATWSADDIWSTTVAEAPGNNRMMKGYINTSNTSTTTVQITSLPAAITANGYDVYVYFDDDTVGVIRNGTYTIGAASIGGADGATFNGAFYPASGNGPGNYVLFTNVTGASCTLLAKPGVSTDAFQRAPINGMQIVARAAVPTTATHFIMGRIANSSGVQIPNVAVTRTGSATPVMTNSAGYFRFDNLPAGNYTLTPSLSGYNFSPTTRTVTVSTADITGQNFTGTQGAGATTYRIMGRIATSAGAQIPNVGVSRTGSATQVLTNSAGYFSFTNVPPGTYTITPQMTGRTFNPQTRTVTVTTADVTGQNFTGSGTGATLPRKDRSKVAAARPNTARALLP